MTDSRRRLGYHQRRVVRERPGIALDEMPGGHLLALSRPTELVERPEVYRSNELTYTID